MKIFKTELPITEIEAFHLLEKEVRSLVRDYRIAGIIPAKITQLRIPLALLKKSRKKSITL